ncbi:hypothetical protein [Winogradskyella sp.]
MTLGLHQLCVLSYQPMCFQDKRIAIKITLIDGVFNTTRVNSYGMGC